MHDFQITGKWWWWWNEMWEGGLLIKGNLPFMSFFINIENKTLIFNSVFEFIT